MWLDRGRFAAALRCCAESNTEAARDNLDEAFAVGDDSKGGRLTLDGFLVQLHSSHTCLPAQAEHLTLSEGPLVAHVNRKRG